MEDYYCEFCGIEMTEEDHHFCDICGDCSNKNFRRKYGNMGNVDNKIK